MTDDELITSLNQIGKSAFVRYFHELRQGHDALLYGEYKPAGVAIRMSYSSRIFKAGREAHVSQRFFLRDASADKS